MVKRVENKMPISTLLVKQFKLKQWLLYVHVILHARTCAQNHFTLTKVSARKY